MTTDRWVTFDCYGTLIDWFGGVGDALQQLWPEVDRESLLASYHDVGERYAPPEGTAPPIREMSRQTLALLAAERGLAVPAGREYALVESVASWPAFPEVPGELRQVRDRGWRMAILTNADPDQLAASLPKLEVPFDLTITLAEARSYKPAPGHWERFFERSGADPRRHVHVAASLFHDIAFAASRGMRCVWINRRGETTDLARTAELTSLSGLADTLDRIEPR